MSVSVSGLKEQIIKTWSMALTEFVAPSHEQTNIIQWLATREVNTRATGVQSWGTPLYPWCQKEGTLKVNSYRIRNWKALKRNRTSTMN